MNRFQHLAGKIAEEAGEVAQRAIKLQIFGPHETQQGHDMDNIERLEEEVNQLFAQWEMLCEELRYEALQSTAHEQIKAKRKAVEKWMQHSREVGLLQDQEPEQEYRPGE